MVFRGSVVPCWSLCGTGGGYADGRVQRRKANICMRFLQGTMKLSVLASWHLARRYDRVAPGSQPPLVYWCCCTRWPGNPNS